MNPTNIETKKEAGFFPLEVRMTLVIEDLSSILGVPRPQNSESASERVSATTGALPATQIFSEISPAAPKIENRENKRVPTAPERAKADATTEEVFFQFFLHS